MKTNNYFLILIGCTTISFGQATASKNQNCVLEKETNLFKKGTKPMHNEEKNIFGSALEIASINPLTGFYRDGFCATGTDDHGIHVVAAEMTDEFLNYSKKQGNDLITPNLQYGFPGLKKGDVWCLCAKRWKEALAANVAPPVLLKATNKKALDYILIIELQNNEKK